MQRRRFCEKVMDIGFEIKGKKKVTIFHTHQSTHVILPLSFFSFNTFSRVLASIWSIHASICIDPSFGVLYSAWTRAFDHKAWSRKRLTSAPFQNVIPLAEHLRKIHPSEQRYSAVVQPFLFVFFLKCLVELAKKSNFLSRTEVRAKRALVVCHSFVAVAMALPWCCHVAYGNEPLRR